MAAYEHIRRGGTETLEMNPTVVRFVWRHASYSMGWSKSQRELLIDEFVLVAEREVSSGALDVRYSPESGHVQCN
jgi:hypothetical protein